MRSTLLDRHRESNLATSLSSSQMELDALASHFQEEASNPAAIASMAMGSLAYQAGRAALLRAFSSRHFILQNSFSFVGALSLEVTTFRASRNFIQGLQAVPLRENDGTFQAQSWLSTALDLGLLKLAGASLGNQNIILRHASQDLALVSAHEMGSALHWIPEEQGSFSQKLMRAEAMNWSLIAGSALALRLSSGKLQRFEQVLRSQGEAIRSVHFSRSESLIKQNSIAAFGANESQDFIIPEALKLRPGDNPQNWARRFMDFNEHPNEAKIFSSLLVLKDILSPGPSREFAHEVVLEIAKLSEALTEGQNFLARRYRVEGLAQPILLLSPPSTFLPEAWSQTFVAGMAKDHAQSPQSRELAIEVGSGTGLVSIAMAKLGIAKRILASDRNGHAPFVGHINALLNGVENIEFYEGDLLHPFPRALKADLIVACLPQMPSRKGPEHTDLRSLADYAESRGVFEDAVGLGLNARLIEEAREHLSDTGKLRMMMAQRPGLPMVHDLFATRGFSPRILHTKLIQQDPGTDFSALAEIEKEVGFRFEFMTAQYQRLSAVNASERSRDSIYHLLHLIEATPYKNLMDRSRRELGESQVAWKYTGDAGSENLSLQRALAEHFQKIWGEHIDPKTVFIAPRMESFVEGVLRLTRPAQAKVASMGLENNPLSGVDSSLLIELPSSLEEATQVLLRESPALAIVRLPRKLLPNSSALDAFLQAAVQKNCLLIFIEEQGALIDPQGKTLLRSLIKFPQAQSQSIVLHSLERLFGFPPLPLAAALVFEPTLRKALAQYGEVTYSRSSSLIQNLYDRFLHQREMQAEMYWHEPPDRGSFSHFPWRTLAPHSLRSRLLDISTHRYDAKTPNPDAIDMSFGESEWAAPLPLNEILENGFARARPADARAASATYLAHSKGLRFSAEELTLGAGVQGLIFSSLRAIAALHPRDRVIVHLPQPGYALFHPTAIAAGIEASPVRTRSANRFLVEAASLHGIPREPGVQNVLLINQATNPVGAYYSWRTLRSLGKAVDYLLQDEVFSGLRFTQDWRNEAGASRASNRIYFGGLSKEFALGGLRFAFAASSNAAFNEVLRTFQALAPDAFAMEAALAVLPQYKSLVGAHRRYLQLNAKRLAELFQKHRFDFQAPEGAFSLFVDLNPILNGEYEYAGQPLRRENFHEVLMGAGVRIASDQWGKVPGHYRFVFSINRLPEAIERLDRFFSEIRPL